MALDGSVVIGTELDEQGLKAGLDQLNKSVNNWGKLVVGSKAFNMITQGLLAAAKAGVSYNAQMEQYQTNFSVLLGDEAKALEYVAQMREKAAKTPFGMEDLASANQTLLSFGLSADEASAAVDMMGDISLGNAERFGSLSLAFAQVSSAGKLTGQDLLQMISNGFNPLNTIAEKTGTNIGDLKEIMAGGKGSKEFQKQMKAAQSEVKKMGDQASEGAKWLAQIGTDGAISAEMIGLAMQAETSPGGRFYNGMEQASQTLGGMWSTLKDDTMQLAGNLFEPVTNGLKNVVLPAAQTVVSGLNSLFEEDNTVTISADVQDAVTNLTTLDEDIQNMKSKWMADAIKIRLDAENAESLLQELETVQAKLEGTPKRLWSEEDKAALQGITSELTAIYPELQKYVGNDGVLKMEAQAVRDLCAEYRQLALEKAAAEYKGEAEKRLLDAQVEHELLKEEVKDMEQRKKVAEETQAAFQKLSEESSAYSNQLAFASITGGEVDTASVEEYLGLVEQFLQLGGQMDSLDTTRFDLSSLFGVTGELKSAEEISASAESLMNLAELLAEINESNFVEQGEQSNAALVQQLTADIDASAAALSESTATIAEVAAEVERVDAVVQKIQSGEIESALGPKLVEDTAASVEENAATLETAVQTVVDGSASSADTSEFNGVGAQIDAGVAAGIRNNTSVVTAAVKSMVKAALKAALLGFKIHSPSHLFEDEIGAMLPWGAAVGVEKNTWRLEDSIDNMVGKSLPDVSNIANSLVQRPLSALSSMPMAAAQAGQMVNQTINFNVPVQTPDEFAQTMFLYNTYGLTEA